MDRINIEPNLSSLEQERYGRAIAELYRQSPSFQVVGGNAYHPGLETMLALDAQLHHPHERFRSIHIAGTNGKGSVAHLLASVLASFGYSVGLYTSPHLLDFRERIRIVGYNDATSGQEVSAHMIPKADVLDFLKRTSGFISNHHPSFFEITTAMAFDYFASQRVDIAVVETGLGGRLDSTNIITPILSIITSIGMDHNNILGDTLEKIAAEKAGIIKTSVPVIIGEVPKETRHIFISAGHLHHAPLVWAKNCRPAATSYPLRINLSQMDLQADVQKLNLETVSATISYLSNLHIIPATPESPSASISENPSASFSKNPATSIPKSPTTSLNPEIVNRRNFLIQSAHIISDAIYHAAERTGLRGRWELLSKSPYTICDIGHNENALRPIMGQLQTLYESNDDLGQNRRFGRLIMIFGMAKDKDIASVVPLLPRQAEYYFTSAQGPRAMPARRLRDLVRGGARDVPQNATQVVPQGGDFGVANEDQSAIGNFPDHITASVASAISLYRADARPDDLVYIGGSSYVVAEALPLY